jgi:methionyl aminopeptidase
MARSSPPWVVDGMALVEQKDTIEGVRAAAQVVARALREMGRAVRPGITTAELDRIAEQVIRDHGARPAFKGYRGFPASICASVNEEVVHGIPGARALDQGDIIGIDVGAELNGWYGDAARTFAVGDVSDEARRLMRVTEDALQRGIREARAGNRVGDISHAVQAHVEEHGFSVVRDLVGHGIGRQMHEEPAVPNFGSPGKGPRLVAGQVLAIEPMVNAGGHAVTTRPDGWTVITKDGRWSAHFEHTVAVGRDGPEILSVLPDEQ